MQDNPTRYGTLSRLFHWGIGVVFIVILGVGLFMGDLEAGATKMTVYTLHKSFGVTVFVFMFARALWRMQNGFIPLPERTPQIVKWAARANIVLLYICLFLMPLSGILMSLLGGYGINYFGVFTIPPVFSEKTPAAGFFYETHEVTGTIVMIALVLHVAGSLYHHFIRRDGVLRRML